MSCYPGLVSPRSSATDWERWVSVSDHTPPSSCLRWTDLKAPCRNKAAESLHEVLGERRKPWMCLSCHHEPQCTEILSIICDLICLIVNKWPTVENTSHGASSGQFPEHQAQRINVCPLEWLKVVHVNRLIQDLWSHVPAEDKVIQTKWQKGPELYRLFA